MNEDINVQFESVVFSTKFLSLIWYENWILYWWNTRKKYRQIHTTNTGKYQQQITANTHNKYRQIRTTNTGKYQQQITANTNNKYRQIHARNTANTHKKCSHTETNKKILDLFSRCGFGKMNWIILNVRIFLKKNVCVFLKVGNAWFHYEIIFSCVGSINLVLDIFNMLRSFFDSHRLRFHMQSFFFTIFSPKLLIHLKNLLGSF